MSDKIAIIVASGTGSRMGGEIPKQFMSLGGKPILVRTIEKFLSIHDCRVILVLSEDGMDYWNRIEHDLDLRRIILVKGGDSRFQSVKNGLAAIAEDSEGVVAIHDGVRPFVNVKTILNSFVVADSLGSAVAYVDSKDSVRVIDEAGNRALERDKVKLIQTPQTFRFSILRKAYEAEYETFFTDDASVVEHSGTEIHLIEGSYSNIKITTPDDLLFGEVILKNSD